MSIDIVNICLVHATLLNCHFHSSRQSSSLRSWRRNVMSVASGAVSNHFTVNRGISSQGTLQRFKNNHSSSLAHDESASIGIEGSRTGSGIVIVIGVHGLHAAEASITQWSDTGFSATSDHLVGKSIRNHAEGFANSVRGRGTSRGNTVVGTLAATFDANHSRRGVTQESGNCKGRNLGTFWLLVQLQHLPLKRFHTSERASNKHSALFRIFQSLRSITQLGILQGQTRGRHGKVSESIVTLGILRVDEVIIGFEHVVGDLGTDLTGIVRDIESGDLAEGGDAVNTVLEEGFVANATAADNSKAGDDNSFLFRVEFCGSGTSGGG
mmetsp:Transcript_12414/g.26415  ORF Transcript_12414/g.26415 Transcript_12414/m.26415 type:complete len:325 (+) Transcript_12414:507-1481(+)